MENNTPEIHKGNAKKAMLFSLGTLALGVATFFGIKIYKNHKHNNDDTDTETTPEVDHKKTVYTSPDPKPRTGLPVNNGSSAFPLRLGTKGDKVKQLQQSLIRTFGAGLLARYGADGQFGNELATALRSKGYGLPLSEADFQKITQEKKAETNTTPKPLLVFDPATIAKGLYNAILSKDFAASLILLKAISSTFNYTLVSESLKTYFINGVHQNLLNAMLGTFKEAGQRRKIEDAFTGMGLKQSGSKWSLSGMQGLSSPLTDLKEGDIVRTAKTTLASEEKGGLIVLPANMHIGRILYLYEDDGLAIIKTLLGKEIRVDCEHLKKYKK